MLTSDTKVTLNRRSNEAFTKYYNTEDSLCRCINIDSVMIKLGFVHLPKGFCLFIEASTTSLKIVLLHVLGNYGPLIPVAYATELKKTYRRYENMKLILNAIQYLLLIKLTFMQ